MSRSDTYFLSWSVAFLVLCVLNGFWLQAVPGEMLQFGFVLILLLPLIWPRMGRWVGVDPLWKQVQGNGRLKTVAGQQGVEERP